MNEIVRDWCGSLPREQILERCYASRAPAGPLNDIADIFGDRQFHAGRNLVAIDDEDVARRSSCPTSCRCPGHPDIDHLGPRLGEHTDEVLKDLLGLTDAEIEGLRAQRVI